MAGYLARTGALTSTGALARAGGYRIAGADSIAGAYSIGIPGSLDFFSSINKIAGADSIAITGGDRVAGASCRMGVATAGLGSIPRLQIAGALRLIDAHVKTRGKNPRQGSHSGQASDLCRLLQEIAPADFTRFRKTDHLEDFGFLFCAFLDGLNMIVRGTA
jgi:hypothetical protein